MINKVTTPEQVQRDFLLGYDYTNNHTVEYIGKAKQLGGTTAYLSVPEMANISSEVNDAGTVLMTFYYRKVSHPKYDFFDDSKVCEALGWNISKTKKTRLALMKAGWVKKIVYVQPTTKAKTTTFFLGKEACAKIETPEEYTSRIKVLEAQRNSIINHFGLETWEEVVAQYSVSEIVKAQSELAK